jgi:hypothetical protein
VEGPTKHTGVKITGLSRSTDVHSRTHAMDPGKGRRNSALMRVAPPGPEKGMQRRARDPRGPAGAAVVRSRVSPLRVPLNLYTVQIYILIYISNYLYKYTYSHLIYIHTFERLDQLILRFIKSIKRRIAVDENIVYH